MGNKIKVDKPQSKESLLPIIKQKPNRKVLGLFRFHMMVYVAAAKHPTRKLNKWVMRTIGEEPVLIDTLLMNKTTQQLQLYMMQQGYYNAVVTDSVYYTKNKTAVVYYNITSNIPYRIHRFEKIVEDPIIRNVIDSTSAESLIHEGDIFSETACSKERERIIRSLKNIGYFGLSPEFFKYSLDSALGTNSVILRLRISNPQASTDSVPGSISLHKRYRVDSVFVYSGFDPLLNDTISSFTDTVITGGYYFLNKPGIRTFKTRVLSNHILIQAGEPYNFSKVEATYKRLADLGVFKFVNIKFDNIIPYDSSNNGMNCYVLITPTKPKNYNVESELTHNGGNIGLAGNISFNNNNALRNGELLEVKLHGSFEATRAIIQSNEGSDKNPFLFNTFDFGPELNFSFREFIFPSSQRFVNPKSNVITTLTTKYNYEVRPEFKRSSANFGLSYNFRNFEKSSFIWSPLVLNLLDVNLSAEFLKRLLQIGDQGLLSSYQQQLITAGVLSFIYASDNRKTRNIATYLRVNLEVSGHTLYAYDKLVGNSQNSENRYTRLGIPYTTYTRPDFDLRLYKFFDSRNTLVFRIASGVGYSYLNSTRMPFDKNFFAGGSNDQRAWLSRTLGPGSFNKGENFNRIGELKINSNLEYRFELLKILEGAAFIDAGNIWNLKKDKDFPGGEISYDRFLDEIAIGAGLGLRFNFTFFIFRVDVGIPVKDPEQSVGHTWLIQKLKLRDSRTNLGIAYPF